MMEGGGSMSAMLEFMIGVELPGYQVGTDIDGEGK